MNSTWSDHCLLWQHTFNYSLDMVSVIACYGEAL